MNLESNGFPVHLYAERANAGTGACPKEMAVEVEEKDTAAQAVTVETDVDEPSIQAFQTQQAGRAGTAEDALSQLADQIPRPNPVYPGVSGSSLQQLALLTQEFNCAMGLPEGASVKIVTPERGQQYGRMLHDLCILPVITLRSTHLHILECRLRCVTVTRKGPLIRLVSMDGNLH